MLSRRLSYLIAFAALLVLGVGSALLLSPSQTTDRQNDNRAAGTPTTVNAKATSSPDIALLVPTVATTVAATSVEPSAATEAPVSPTLPAPTATRVVAVSTASQAHSSSQPQSLAPTAVTVPRRDPEKVGGPVQVPNNHGGRRWVTLQAGHLNNQNLPTELQHLVPNTGAFAAGVSEVDVNEAVAGKAAQRLIERGYSVDLIDATVPVSYTTDLFLAIHADGNVRASVRGFKAVAPWNSVPASDDFVAFLYEEYGKATGLPSDAMTSVAMANYYAFNPTRYRHAVSANVPSALLEMGFVTNPEDRKLLTVEQDRAAWGIANAVDRYFRSGKAGTIPTAYPSFTPTVTPTSTSTNTATPTNTATASPTHTATPVPTEMIAGASETAVLITPTPPTATPRPPTPTRTLVPTPTPLQGIITANGRWLPPLSLNGRSLPRPGSSAPPVLMSVDTESLSMRADGREAEQVWQQLYMPELGRSVWKKGELRPVRH